MATKFDVVTAIPAVYEPITVQEVKDQARLLHDDLDQQIGQIIAASRLFAENITGRALIKRTLTLYRMGFEPKMILPWPPLLSVTEIQYKDVDGVLQTLDPAVYAWSLAAAPGYVYLNKDQSWPQTERIADSVQISYEAGYGDGPEDVPDTIRQAMLAYAASLLNYPQHLVGHQVYEVPGIYHHLLADYRVFL